MRRKYLTFLLIGSLVLSMAGCAPEGGQQETSEELIELIEPVNAELSYETVTTRDIYGASVYAATVVPYVEEYSANNNFPFASYGAFLGVEVKKGTELIAPDTTSMDEEIEKKKEYITSMDEEYQKYIEKQQKALQEQREIENEYAGYVKTNEEDEPDQFLPSEDGGEQVANPEYATWKAGYDYVTGVYRIAKHAGDTIQLQMDQKKELYELDRKHQEYLLGTLQKNRREATVTAGMDGTVVALQSYDSGDYVMKEDPVAAVADLSRKFLKCDYISKNIINKAKDVYALIDGKRYEVEYQEMSTDEYARLSADGNKVYSTFKIQGEIDDVQVGSYAVIAVISDMREDVVSVPKRAIKKDELGNFVYVLKDSQSVRTSVQLGYSDGAYTEILTGLEVGDKILYASEQSVGTGTVTLGKGEFHSEFSQRADLTYSSVEPRNNPVEYGTVYFGEYRVSQYQHINKGDVICTVRVEPDQLSLSGNETRISRLRERLEDYKTNNKDKEKEEAYIETVENYQKQIEEIEKTINEQKADFAVKTIKAERSGIVLYLPDYKNESIVQKNAAIAWIADATSCYMKVENENQLLQYGNPVQVSYTDAQGQEKEVECMVASMSKMGVSRALQSDTANVLLPEECIEDILQGLMAGDFWNRNRFKVNAKLRKMNNVLVVPKSAVFEIAGKTYVYIKESDGSVKAQGFVSGGFNESYYWVVQGLTEGMEVCLK